MTPTRIGLLLVALAAVVVVSMSAGFIGGYWASALHPGPPGRDATAQGCWHYEIANRPTPAYNTLCLDSKR